MKAVAPGKIILSGEHAVVHGLPAIAMAVERHATTQIVTQAPNLISFDIADLRYHKSHTINALRKLKRRIQADYQQFLKGEYNIRQVLRKPFELSQYALTHLLDKLNVSLANGLKLHTESTIPIGCGMGSSAATILSVVHAINNHFNLNLPMEAHFSYALEAENMQHGHSSGLDLQVSMRGGCIHYQDGVASAREVPNMPMYLINSGSPDSSTGECVSHTNVFFKDSEIVNGFAATIDKFDQALQNQHYDLLQQAVRENHQLLMQLGIVPQTVALFIAECEKMHGAAKICGAGTIHGEKAGMILLLSEQDPSELCQRFGYECNLIKGETNGLHTI